MSLVHIETNNPVIRVFPVRNNRSVFDMLRAQDRNIFFNGGLDKHFLKALRRINWREYLNQRRLTDSIVS